MGSATEEHIIVAIDGPAGSGKSTVARLVARGLGALLLDTGAIYRGLALYAQRHGCSFDDGPGLAELARRMPLSFEAGAEPQHVLLASEDVTETIRTPEVSQGASAVSQHQEVRTALLETQRAFAARGPVVAEGRDIGTVVFPHARVKVFLVADEGVRAQRRFAELEAAGQDVSFEGVQAEQGRRDEADASRAVAPLKPAADAVTIDSSGLTPEQVADQIIALCDDRRGSSAA